MEELVKVTCDGAFYLIYETYMNSVKLRYVCVCACTCVFWGMRVSRSQNENSARCQTLGRMIGHELAWSFQHAMLTWSKDGPWRPVWYNMQQLLSEEIHEVSNRKIQYFLFLSQEQWSSIKRSERATWFDFCFRNIFAGMENWSKAVKSGYAGKSSPDKE